MIAQGYILAIAAAAAFATGGGLAWTAQGWRLDAKEAELALAAGHIEACNSATAKFKAISDKATTAAKSADQRASEAQAKARPQTEAKRAAIAANSGPQSCSAAIQAIRKGRP